jgi:hypothetical protein
VDNVDWKAARKTGDHIHGPVANANPAILSANGWTTKYVPVTYHSIAALIVQGSLAESRENWGEENAIYANDAKHVPGIYAAAEPHDIEQYVNFSATAMPILLALRLRSSSYSPLAKKHVRRHLLPRRLPDHVPCSQKG